MSDPQFQKVEMPTTEQTLITMADTLFLILAELERIKSLLEEADCDRKRDNRFKRID